MPVGGGGALGIHIDYCIIFMLKVPDDVPEHGLVMIMVHSYPLLSHLSSSDKISNPDQSIQHSCLLLGHSGRS